MRKVPRCDGGREEERRRYRDGGRWRKSEEMKGK